MWSTHIHTVVLQNDGNNDSKRFAWKISSFHSLFRCRRRKHKKSIFKSMPWMVSSLSFIFRYKFLSKPSWISVGAVINLCRSRHKCYFQHHKQRTTIGESRQQAKYWKIRWQLLSSPSQIATHTSLLLISSSTNHQLIKSSPQTGCLKQLIKSSPNNPRHRFHGWNPYGVRMLYFIRNENALLLSTIVSQSLTSSHIDWT